MSTLPSEPSEGTRHPIINPANGELIDYVDWSTPEQIDSAIETAAGAYPDWSETPVKERVQVLFSFKQVIESKICTSFPSISIDKRSISSSVIEDDIKLFILSFVTKLFVILKRPLFITLQSPLFMLRTDFEDASIQRPFQSSKRRAASWGWRP